MNLTMHQVSTIELVNRFVSNGNSRTIRITGQQWINDEAVPAIIEITLYGNTASLEALPHAAKLVDHSPAKSAQVDIEDYLRAPPVADLAPITPEMIDEIAREAEASELSDIGAVRMEDR